MPTSKLTLQGFEFSELHTEVGLKKLDEQFLKFLAQKDPSLKTALLNLRQNFSMPPQALSDWIVACAPVVEEFIAQLFAIEKDVHALQEETLSHNPIFAFKKYYVLREAKRAFKGKVSDEEFYALHLPLLERLRLPDDVKDLELSIAQYGVSLLANPEDNCEVIQILVAWCVAAMASDAGQKIISDWVSFHLPQRLNYENLIPTTPVPNDIFGRLQGKPENFRQRDGFKLTDPRMNARQVQDQVHYCVYCHKTDGDFCSKGFPVKKGDPQQGLKINPLGDALTGCPLDEKISEMHLLKNMGYGIAALATVMIDNPMCPATGHRICNDCMKACIYQKQEPVNIPQIETRVLTDVLNLPWGVEIYDLLTRWNPLRTEQWRPKIYNGKKILVMGMGPAGFTLAHHLLMEGFAVVGVDGLKLEPLPEHLIHQPIYSFHDLKEALDDRIMTGFGGVAEYGITVRWDKNFLKLIYIHLLRHPFFQIYGGVRFGGTLTVDDAWTLGFDHCVIAVGAGLPRELNIPNSLAPGMRQANDFLMALQLTGAAKKSSLANLQVRLPAVVIGGGLTGIDTATEVQAYYLTQIEKTSERYYQLANFFGEKVLRARFDLNDLEILDEFLNHAKILADERLRATTENRVPDLIGLIREWGGVTVAYRREMQASPAYRRNHEEVTKAFEEGIYYAEGLEPLAVRLNDAGYVKSLVCRWRILDEEGNWKTTDEEQILPAASIFVATGAKPNIAYEFEHRGTFLRVGENYQRFNLIHEQLTALEEIKQENCKENKAGIFTSYQSNHRFVTFIGDTHPVFHGSVVKAIASAKRAYPQITAALKNHHQQMPGDNTEYLKFKEAMSALLTAQVVSVQRYSEHYVELKVRAPLAAKNFQPGQFYRIQNYECLAPIIEGTRLQTEAMAMIAAQLPNEPDILSFLILERGASSRLVATFKSGEPIALMGPTGAKIKIPHNKKETLLIIGGTMASVHVLSIGAAYKKAGHRVIYLALMKDKNDLHHRDALEAVTDMIFWLTDQSAPIVPQRPQDFSAKGELITNLRAYGLGFLQAQHDAAIPLNEVSQVMVIGSSQLLRRIQQARKGLLKEFFGNHVEWIASVYGPMQCMLKGVCAQCLQWQVDPATGLRTKAVYACSWQHQPLEKIDLRNIDERLVQNQVQEILTNAWLDYIFAEGQVERV